MVLPTLSESAIAVDRVSKCFAMYAKPQDRLMQAVVPRLQRVFGQQPRSFYREFWALTDVSFQVRRGETLGIVGRNGSGKSTLLQIVCGTLTQTAGSVQTSGRIAALLELGAGFNPEFTGEENVRLSALLYGLTALELIGVYDSILSFAELGEFIKRPVKTYSSGMYVRLAFAVAAHINADVLIIDEALSVGDVLFSQKCARFLRDFQSRGTLLFVSHDLAAVLNLCSRAIWLERGRVVRDGRSKDVVEAYLAQQHALDRALAGSSVTINSHIPAPESPPKSDGADFQAVAINAGFREPLEFEPFSGKTEQSDFGQRKVEITAVKIVDATTRSDRRVLGGEVVCLSIEALAHDSATQIIFGFYVKDRLGQRLFGDNSYLAYLDSPPSASAGQVLQAEFVFRMPIMPAAEYTVDVAVATGSQLEHTQQHWIHDAITFRSTDKSMKHGLIGIPILNITICIASERRELYR